MSDPAVVAASERLEGLLAGFASSLGRDEVAYGNHVRRVFGLVRAQDRFLSSEQLEQVAIAAVFHDIGVWLDDTWDYLGPSQQHAAEYLAAEGLGAWEPTVSAIIVNHHKLRPYKGDPTVEFFRRADLCDLTFGRGPTGIPRAEYLHLRSMFPVAGFHKRLVQIGGLWGLKHPLKPAPMMRW